MTAVSRAFISSCVPSSVTVVIQLIAPSGAPARRARFVHDLGDARDAADRRRVRADHDRAARLERDQDLVDRRRRRVRRRDDRRDDAERLGDLDDLAVLEPADDADGLHRPDEVGRPCRRRRGSSGPCRRRRRSRFLRAARRARASACGVTACAIASTMASICSWESSARRPAGLLRAARERPRFVNGGEVAIGLGRGLRHA